MNIFDLAKMKYPSNITASRAERIKREGSPPYVWTPGAIAATASSAIHVPTQFPASRKYEPLDFLEVVNNDAVDLTLTVNGDDQFNIPAASIRKVRGAMWHISLTNLDAAINSTAGKIILTFRREPMTADKWTRERA